MSTISVRGEATRVAVFSGLVALLFLLVLQPFVAGAAPAVGGEPVCGSSQGASQLVKATLALADTDPETVTTALYGRKTGVRQLTLVYTVTGCRLADELAPPEDPPPIGPPKDNKIPTLPKGVLRLDGDPEIDGNQYVVHMQVFTSPPTYTGSRKTISPKFDPGTYGGFVHLKAKWMHRTGTSVAISRSENRWQSVLLVAVVGALGGFAFFLLMHEFSKAEFIATPWKKVIAGVVSVAAGTYVAYTTSYLNQDVWTFGANTIALLTAAFTAATSGQLVTGLLGKAYDVQTDVNEQQHPITIKEAPPGGLDTVKAYILHPGRTRKAKAMKEKLENEAGGQADGQQVG